MLGVIEGHWKWHRSIDRIQVSSCSSSVVTMAVWYGHSYTGRWTGTYLYFSSKTVQVTFENGTRYSILYRIELP